MAAEDYKSDVSLTSACGQELAVLQCANKEEKEDGVHVAVQLSTVLLCLEAGVREEKVKVIICFSKCAKRYTALVILFDDVLFERERDRLFCF